MFFIILALLILLVLLAAIIVAQNYGILLSTNIHLIFISWSLPGIPVILLCIACVFLGGLVLYAIATRSAHRDVQEIKTLKARIEELESLQTKSTSGGSSSNFSGGSSSNFAPPVVPLPGFASGGPLGSSGSANQPGPALGASGPGPGPAGPMGQRQPPPNQPQNMSPSASSNTLPLPPRLFPPQAPQQPQQPMGGPRPPFPQS